MSLEHLIERAKQRYDLDLDVNDIKAIRQKVFKGDCVMLRTEPKNGSKVVLVKHHNTVIYTVLSIETNYIRTFLPRSANTRENYLENKRKDGKTRRKAKKSRRRRWKEWRHERHR